MIESERVESIGEARAAAGALFFNEDGRVLLVRPTYKSGWEIPGGYLRPGETPTEAAAREVAEELGIRPPIGRLLVADWAPHPAEGDKILFVFDGGPLGPDQVGLIRPDPVEIAGWAFHDRSRTNAEIVLSLYQSIRVAAGPETILLGCNTVGHLAAGLFELQRTGDDTSGQHWERTRRMGVNTLAYRLPQNRTFFTIDADCVGITHAIPWELNRQWLDLIARSGSALFLSPSPDAVGPQQKADIAEAFAIAAAGNTTGHPVDWFNSTTPSQWQFETGHSPKPSEKRYNWCGQDGCDPYPI